MSDYHGHRTMPDGSHEPLSKDEAEALWRAVEARNADRAEAMPTAQDALRAIINAKQRLNDLGWREGGGLSVRRGDECAVAQSGSTGIWHGHLDAQGEYVHFCDCVAKPRDAWLKPLSDLSPEERTWMEECDKREAEAYRAMIDRLPAQSPHPPAGGGRG